MRRHINNKQKVPGTSKKFYITAAIDYVNSLPHIGTAYEKIGADVLARLKKMSGITVHFQMGNDEHSSNVFKAAKQAGLEPKVYCDQMRIKFEEIWKKLDIKYDDFIQTTETRHIKGVQKLFKEIYKNGFIEKRLYEGWYCESCEAFFTEKDLIDGLCPNHKSKPKWLKEENYFFKLSDFQDSLSQHIKSHKEFILPELRRNEILRVIEGGLKDISVSRSSIKWGIPVPFDKDHVVYVWFDALINYITALGYGKNKKKFEKWWNPETTEIVHIIGKDITRFHCIIWPAMLMAAKIRLPTCVFGHGFVYLKGEKMSKTLGNVVTPMDVIDAYGPDALRYYLLRTSGFGQDADFTWDDFIRRYNGDLANGLGNLVSRTLGMIEKYLGGKIKPVLDKASHLDEKLEYEIISTYKEIKKIAKENGPQAGNIEFHKALEKIWNSISAVDLYINENKPWKIKDKKQLERILYKASEAIRIITLLIYPFIPSTAKKIWEQFGFKKLEELKNKKFKEEIKWGELKGTRVSQKRLNLFPRIEVPGITTSKKEPKMEQKEPVTKYQVPDLIDITDFTKVDLRVAQVLQAEKVEGADKLLKLQIDLGEEKRQIVAGIAQHYSPDDLVGKKIVIVANLKPVKIRGVESNGMLLAASDASVVSILTPLKDVAIGSKVK